MSNRAPRLLAFFGHHKGASSWLALLCREVSRDLGLNCRIVWHADLFERQLDAFVERNKIHFLAYTNADYRYVQQLDNVRGFHVVRDPRDVCVSAYFSHLTSHPTEHWPELVDHRKKLKAVPKDEGLFLDMDFLENHFEEMRSWKGDNEDILEVKMEKITAAPYQSLLEVFGFLGLIDELDFSPTKRAFYVFSKVFRRLEYVAGNRFSIPIAPKRLSAERLLGIVWENDFSKRTGGRKQGEEDPQSHYRKGVPGDWRNHFTDDHVRYFKERYGDLLLQYGYESSADWS